MHFEKVHWSSERSEHFRDFVSSLGAEFLGRNIFVSSTFLLRVPSVLKAAEAFVCNPEVEEIEECAVKLAEFLKRKKLLRYTFGIEVKSRTGETMEIAKKVGASVAELGLKVDLENGPFIKIRRYRNFAVVYFSEFPGIGGIFPRRWKRASCIIVGTKEDFLACYLAARAGFSLTAVTLEEPPRDLPVEKIVLVPERELSFLEDALLRYRDALLFDLLAGIARKFSKNIITSLTFPFPGFLQPLLFMERKEVSELIERLEIPGKEISFNPVFDSRYEEEKEFMEIEKRTEEILRKVEIRETKIFQP